MKRGKYVMGYSGDSHYPFLCHFTVLLFNCYGSVYLDFDVLYWSL